jgi:hypothetical protein
MTSSGAEPSNLQLVAQCGQTWLRHQLIYTLEATDQCKSSEFASCLPSVQTGSLKQTINLSYKNF